MPPAPAQLALVPLSALLAEITCFERRRGAEPGIFCITDSILLSGE